MNRRSREIRAIVDSIAADYEIELTQRNHFKVTIEGPRGREVGYYGSNVKDVHTIQNIRTDLRKRAAKVGALVSV